MELGQSGDIEFFLYKELLISPDFDHCPKFESIYNLHLIVQNSVIIAVIVYMEELREIMAEFFVITACFYIDL